MSKVLKLSSLFVMVLAFVLLCGCAPKDVAKAEEKMTEAGYLCKGYQSEEAEGFVGGFFATKLTENLTAALYDSSKAAKEAAEELSDKDSIQVIGKWVVWGSEGAIKAFKK